MPGTETGIKLRGIVQLKPWTQKRFNEVSFLVRFHMPGKPRNRRLEARLTQRNSLVRNNDYPTTESLQRDRTAVRLSVVSVGLSLVPNYFAGGFQFRRSVIEELTASSVVTLIRS